MTLTGGCNTIPNAIADAITDDADTAVVPFGTNINIDDDIFFTR